MSVICPLTLLTTIGHVAGIIGIWMRSFPSQGRSDKCYSVNNAAGNCVRPNKLREVPNYRKKEDQYGRQVQQDGFRICTRCREEIRRLSLLFWFLFSKRKSKVYIKYENTSDTTRIVPSLYLPLAISDAVLLSSYKSTVRIHVYTLADRLKDEIRL
jgi:hypothetical protein